MKTKSKRASRATLRSLGERGLINWILPRLRAQPGRRFLVPPGDDAAVLSSIGRPVLSIDGLSEGTHFKLSWEARVRRAGFSLGRGLGWKLMGSSLSDLAAMGEVDNRWAMIFVGAPPHVSSDFLKDFFLGLQDWARAYRCTLAGGDTVRAQTLTLVAAVGGTLSSAKPLTREGARAGDWIGIAGTVGDAERGLKVLSGKLRLPKPASTYFVRRFFAAEPLFESGRLLARTSGVSALIDLSDSLTESVELLLSAKKMGWEINLDKLPRSPKFTRAFGLQPTLLPDGEDYGLLFTASPRAAASLVRNSAVAFIGRVTKSRAQNYLIQGRPVRLPPRFEHFS